MKPLKSSTLFYVFKCDGTLISYKLKPAGKIFNIVGASTYFEIPVSYIHNYSLIDSGPYYVIDLKVNSYKFSKDNAEFRHLRLCLLKSTISGAQYKGLTDVLDKQTSFDLWHFAFYNKLSLA